MTWQWVTLALLGAWHGVNPGMGWLFAVSRGLQERSGAAVVRALPPIALGHALAIAVALAALAAGKLWLTGPHLRWAVAAVVIGYGVLQLLRHRHPRWVGMRIGFGGLLLWSFLMATGHGAGLMLVPLFVAGGDGAACHTEAGLTLSGPGGYAGATLLHTAAMLLVAGAIALIVYHRVGLALLRRAWFNLDWLWAIALIVSGLAAVLV